MIKKQILIIVATHGDEKIGLELIKILRKKGLAKYFDWLIGNPRALKLGTRYVEADLNRSYPGIKNSKIYEQKIAFKNLNIAKQYRYIVDVHEASCGINDFIIIPRKKISKKFPLSFINLKTILLWPDPNGSLAQCLNQAIELEFGMKGMDREKVIFRAVKIVEKFIRFIYQKKRGKSIKQKNIYYVYGKLMKNENNENQRLRDFKLRNLNKESFYPLLVNQYIKENIICYKMKKYFI